MARRWVCPVCGRGVNGPDRPRKDDVRRWCLDCSAVTGRLVERTSPALERKRQQGADRSAALQRRKREREQQAKIDALSATVTVNGVLTKVRIDKLLAEVWKLPTRVSEAPREPVPPITVRRGTMGNASGRCWYDHRIVVTIGRVDLAEAEALVIHEAAHQIAHASGRRESGDHHGRLFRSINRNLVTEYTGVPMTDEGLTSRGFYEATMAHLRQHPAP